MITINWRDDTKYQAIPIISSENLIHKAKIGDEDSVRILLEHHRVDPSAYDQLAIKLACLNGHVPVVQLLRTDNRVDASRPECLYNAALGGHTELVRYLLDHTLVDVSQVSDNFFQTASRLGNSKIVDIFITYPAFNLSADQLWWGIYYFARHQNADKVLIKLLKDERAKGINKQEFSAPLEDVVKAGNLEVLLAFEHVLDISLALQFAAMSNQIHIIKFILENCKAIPNRRVKMAIKHACWNHHMEALAIILQHFPGELPFVSSEHPAAIVSLTEQRLGSYLGYKHLRDNGFGHDPASAVLSFVSQATRIQPLNDIGEIPRNDLLIRYHDIYNAHKGKQKQPEAKNKLDDIQQDIKILKIT